ncbi:MAG: hypothetical protein ABIW84_00640 [Ilumatobacteraceae bacterium]
MEPITAEAIAALADERHIMEESETDQAERLFRQNLVPAVQSIVNIALYSDKERLRLQAATYVVERNLGRLQDVVAEQARDPFKDLLAECIENFATDGGTDAGAGATG